MLSALSGVFGWASEHHEEADPRLVGHNPATGWKKLRKAEGDREVLIDPADVPRIWRAFDVAPAPWPAVYKLCLLTVARRGELQGLRWDDLRDLDGADARAELRSRTKAGKELDRVIALTPMAVEIIRSIPRVDGAAYVFGTVRPLPDDSTVDAEIREAAGLAYHWSPHAFRHLFATWAHDKAGALSDEAGCARSSHHRRARQVREEATGAAHASAAREVGWTLEGGGLQVGRLASRTISGCLDT